jgi:hypothetical protein
LPCEGGLSVRALSRVIPPLRTKVGDVFDSPFTDNLLLDLSRANMQQKQQINAISFSNFKQFFLAVKTGVIHYYCITARYN